MRPPPLRGSILDLQIKESGYTLIELMIVVAILSVLAGAAIPKFSTLIVKGQEAATKGNLGALRSALSIYYSDTEGVWPATLAVLPGKWISSIPNAYFPPNP